MDFQQLIKDRFSVRKFAPTPIEEEKLTTILEAAQVAPTACNNQPQRIYVLKSKEALTKISSVVKYIFNAPLVFMICVNEDVSWKNSRDAGYSSGEMDASIVCTQMMLQAQALGLGSLWIRGYATEDVTRLFPLPLGERLVCLLAVGYAAPDAKPAPYHTKREPLENIVRFL